MGALRRAATELNETAAGSDVARVAAAFAAVAAAAQALAEAVDDPGRLGR